MSLFKLDNLLWNPLLKKEQWNNGSAIKARCSKLTGCYKLHISMFDKVFILLHVATIRCYIQSYRRAPGSKFSAYLHNACNYYFIIMVYRVWLIAWNSRYGRLIFITIGDELYVYNKSREFEQYLWSYKMGELMYVQLYVPFRIFVAIKFRYRSGLLF